MEAVMYKTRPKNWVCFGGYVPKNEITFIVQSSVLIVVIITSLINLSLETGLRDMNISLLSSSLGAFLPGPTFPNRLRSEDDSDGKKETEPDTGPEVKKDLIAVNI